MYSNAQQQLIGFNLLLFFNYIYVFCSALLKITVLYVFEVDGKNDGASVLL